MQRVIVAVAGGDPVPSHVARALPAHAEVIAADSGLTVALALGLSVDLVVGDLDSVEPRALARARAAGVEIEQHPAAKNHTDLALAMDAAVTRGATRIVVVGGHGGRLDHGLANALLLAAPAYWRKFARRMAVLVGGVLRHYHWNRLTTLSALSP